MGTVGCCQKPTRGMGMGNLPPVWTTQTSGGQEAETGLPALILSTDYIRQAFFNCH